MNIKTKQKVILTMILASSVVMVGCSQPSTDTNTSTVVGVSSIAPTGTIQGNLIDAVTQQPIVGAVIDIGVAIATTNVDGQFVLANVPATRIGTGAAQGASLIGEYQVTINLKGVTSPFNMSDATIVKRYPDFSFKKATVQYTSDVSHPLNGIATGVQFTVGKLAATITGVVTDKLGTPVAAGFDVSLYSDANAQNSSTGANGQGPVANPDAGSGHIVGAAKTDANGMFTFANIEAGALFTIAAQDTGFTLFGESAQIKSPTENATRTLTVQGGDAIKVLTTDTVAPKVVSVTPEQNFDAAPGKVDVAFTFSEPIKMTSAVKDTSPSITGGIYSKVNVSFIRNKVRTGNIAHTLAWSADRKTLTVTLPAAGASGEYSVDIANATPLLTDDNDNVMAAGVAATPNAAAPAANVTAKLAVDFTTKGGLVATAPTAISMTNSASLDAATRASATYGGAVGTLTVAAFAGPVAPNLDWTPSSGAKKYNVYRTMNQVWGATSNAHQAVLINSTANSSFSDPFAAPLDYVEGSDIKLTYNYQVFSVGSDGLESATGTTTTLLAADKIGPSLASTMNAGVPVQVLCAGASIAVCDATAKVTTITLPFNEKVEKVSAAKATNYTIALDPLTAGAAPTVTSAVFDSATQSVKLTLSAATLPADFPRVGITTGADGIANTAASGGDTTLIPLGTGLPNAVCITAGANGVLNTVVAVAPADDVIVGTTITAGANGKCETTANVVLPADDVQVIAVGKGQANTLAITPTGTAGVMSTAVGDDIKASMVTVTGVTDIAGNAIKATASHFNKNGSVN